MTTVSSRKKLIRAQMRSEEKIECTSITFKPKLCQKSLQILRKVRFRSQKVEFEERKGKYRGHIDKGVCCKQTEDSGAKDRERQQSDGELYLQTEIERNVRPSLRKDQKDSKLNAEI